MILFSGHCETCGLVHALPATEAALAEARRRIGPLRQALTEDKGRMLGVLLGHDHLQREVVLKAYSGTTPLDGLELGWAPTTRRVEATQTEEADTFVQLNALSAQIEALEFPRFQARLAEAKGLYESQLAEMQRLRREAKAERATRRANAPEDAELHERLRQMSWDENTAYRKRLAALRVPIEKAHAQHEAVLAEMQVLKTARRALSNRLQSAFWAEHTLVNFRGAALPMKDAHARDAALLPGAGECAAPKLLQDAARRGVRPFALAEVWVGPLQKEPRRVQGQAYGPCDERCRPILGHLLCGADAPPTRSPRLDLDLLAEGHSWVAVAKPSWVLAVPGRGPEKIDSVVTRVRHFYGAGAAAQAAHRLDMETSGVMVVALDGTSQAHFHDQFLARTPDKTYLAWVEGHPAADEGLIDLPLRPITRKRRHQGVHPDGKAAQTKYRVLARSKERTLIEFTPLTGRSHQLRVHAADPQGLGAAIVGDSLYGVEGPYLLLHAWKFAFDDPDTGVRHALTCPLPAHWPQETHSHLDQS